MRLYSLGRVQPHLIKFIMLNRFAQILRQDTQAEIRGYVGEMGILLEYFNII